VGSWSWLGAGAAAWALALLGRRPREGVELTIGWAGVRANDRSARQRKAEQGKEANTLPT
jgi:hypothetical protein